MTAESDDAPRAFVAAFRPAPRVLTAADETRLTEPAFRTAVFAAIDRDDDARDRPLAIALLRREMALRRDERGDYDDLLCAAFLVALKRRLEDVLLIWETKTIDFDTHFGIDVQLMVFCGVDATLAYLKGRHEPEAADAAQYIADCRKAGDFDAMDGYAEAKQAYFGFRR